ncbi:MAG: SRPBCC domain-containing protein [Acidobacteria bacterium]|nr:SRPBCC domain-containing protein [Acidobacteriota bacterium]
MGARKPPRQVSASTQIRARAGRVFSAFLEPELLQQWWGPRRALVEPRKGGVWALAWGDSAQGYQYVVSGVIRSLLPERRLLIDPLVYFNAERAVLGPMRLSIALREKGGARESPCASRAMARGRTGSGITG